MAERASLAEPTYRLIPSRFPPVSAFEDVTSAEDLPAVMELEGWTNDRLVETRLSRLPRDRWIFGRSNASVVMAAFLHSAPNGARFTGPDLGAWYASLSERTAIAEVAHHLRRQALNEGRQSDRMIFRCYGARLAGDNYLDLRGAHSARPELYDRRRYGKSQLFGEAERAAGRDGLLYDSLRHAGGTNAVCFDPTKVLDVVQRDHFEVQVRTDPGRKILAVRLPA